MNHYDFVIVGAGILGLSMAKQLCESYPQSRIAIVEKESVVGLHASGRNSGVLHSGIYYPPESLKARYCAKGAALMRTYCQEHQLPYEPMGKVIVPTKEQDAETLKLLYDRGLANGAKVELINQQQLQELEPETYSVTGSALYVPETTVIDPKRVLEHLYMQLKQQGVTFYFNAPCRQVLTKEKRVRLEDQQIGYDHLINTAGLYADRVAQMCGMPSRYTMLPFKGLYYELTSSHLRINRLIYPVPDMNVPFLGVHFTKSVYGKIYAGPTAIPALGREQYRGLNTMKVSEASLVLYHMLKQYHLNHQGFRAYAHQEVTRFIKPYFIKAARVLVPSLNKNDLKLSTKVGIRAQLLDRQKNQLVMDFLTEKTANETHILNAVSPAFTSSFQLAAHVVGGLHT